MGEFSVKRLYIGRAAVGMALSVIGLLMWASQASAIGITPPEVVALTVLRDTTQTKGITLSKDPDKLNEAYEYTTEVRSDYPGVIEIDPSFEIPSGVRSLNVPFTINAKDLSNGTYSVLLLFYEHKKADSNTNNGGTEAQVAIVSGVAVRITFTVVGEESISYALNNLQAKSTETDDPLNIEFTINNTGNVFWRPEKVELFFADTHDNQNTETLTIQEADIPVTNPGAEQIVEFDVRPELIEGSYTVTAVFFDEGKEVDRLESQEFDVFAPGTLAQSGSLDRLATNKTEYSLGENVKIDADFTNTGEIRVNGTLITEIYKDGSLLDLRKGESIAIDAGETSYFSEIFTVDKVGTYTITSYIEYGNKKSPKKSVDIVVKAAESVLSPMILPWITIGVLSLCIILIAVLIKLGRSRKRAIQQSVATTQSTTTQDNSSSNT